MIEIDCKKLRDEWLLEAKQEIETFKIKPKLVVVQVKGDDASNVYVRNKKRACEQVGIEFEHILLPENSNFTTVATTLFEKGQDKNVHGLMLQLPLNKQLKGREQELLNFIPYQKDVDGLTTESVGRLWSGLPCLTPATPTAVIKLLKQTYKAHGGLSGKSVVVAGRSKLVGQPLIKLLLNENASVSTLHSKSNYDNMYDLCQNADIFISAIGKPKYWKVHWFLHKDDKDNTFYINCQTFIDVGINRDENGKLCGDIDIDNFNNYTYDLTTFTPVPKGIGLLTVAQLVLNTIHAYKLQEY